MKLNALALAAGLMMAGGAHATNYLALDNTLSPLFLGAFGAPTTYGDTFQVTSQGTINHSLTFTITDPLFAGSGVSDIPLSVSAINYELNIDGLSAEIFDSSNNLYLSFVENGDADHLVLPDDSFFAAGDYTLKIGGTSSTNGGFYSVAAATVPVPEPETWAMLLVGMGLVGLRVQQKAKASREAALA